MPLLQEEIKEMQKNQVHAPFNFTIGVALAFQPQKAIFRAVLRWTSVLHNEGKSYCWNLHIQKFIKCIASKQATMSRLSLNLLKAFKNQKESRKRVKNQLTKLFGVQLTGFPLIEDQRMLLASQFV